MFVDLILAIATIVTVGAAFNAIGATIAKK